MSKAYSLTTGVDALLRELMDEKKKEEERTAAEKASAAAEAERTAGLYRAEIAGRKSDSLWNKMNKYGTDQTSRYDELIDYIKNGNYLESDVANRILSSYLAQAQSAADNAIATAGGENGGNIDSYAAANAARQKIAYTDAGQAAALDYYDRQVSNLLDTIKALGGDTDALFGRMQDNTDSTSKDAKDLLTLSNSLASDLMDDETANREVDSKTLSDLFDAYTKIYDASEKSDVSPSVSPMEIANEYSSLIKNGDEASGGEAYSPTDALILLWKKYPAMQSYIEKMYEEYLKEEKLYRYVK